MRNLTQDLFRQAMDKSRESVSWELLTPSQKTELVSQYLLGTIEGPAGQK